MLLQFCTKLCLPHTAEDSGLTGEQGLLLQQRRRNPLTVPINKSKPAGDILEPPTPKPPTPARAGREGDDIVTRESQQQQATSIIQQYSRERSRGRTHCEHGVGRQARNRGEMRLLQRQDRTIGDSQGPVGNDPDTIVPPFLLTPSSSLFPHGPTGRMNGRAQIPSSPPPPPPPPPPPARKFKTFGLQSNWIFFSPPLHCCCCCHAHLPANPPLTPGLPSLAPEVSYVASVGATIGNEGPELSCRSKKKKKKKQGGG